VKWRPALLQTEAKAQSGGGALLTRRRLAESITSTPSNHKPARAHKCTHAHQSYTPNVNTPRHPSHINLQSQSLTRPRLPPAAAERPPCSQTSLRSVEVPTQPASVYLERPTNNSQMLATVHGIHAGCNNYCTKPSLFRLPLRDEHAPFTALGNTSSTCYAPSQWQSDLRQLPPAIEQLLNVRCTQRSEVGFALGASAPDRK
jgi:hypothetical protein